MAIKPIGRFYQTDKAGNLVNECHVDNITTAFRHDVEYLQALCEGIIPRSCFHSLYLRGSVPRGLASDASDIDLFAILDCDREMCDMYQSKVRNSFLAIKRKIDFGVYTLAEVTSLPEWELAFVIKINSLCLSGRDLIPSLPHYQPTVKIVAGYANLSQDIRLARSIMCEDLESATRFCRWICKSIVRTGLAICIQYDSRYSPDLWFCYTVFCEWFPTHSTSMLIALELAVDDAPDIQRAVVLLDGFGSWIGNEAKLRLNA